MASLSPEYMFADEHKNKGIRRKKHKALHMSLLSGLSGSAHPLLMTDTGEAERKAVVYAIPGNS